jgi:hypothetical protein
MKFCAVVPEICGGQVHGARKERRITRTRIIIIIIRNGAKTISLQMLFGRLNYITFRRENSERLSLVDTFITFRRENSERSSLVDTFNNLFK